MPDRRALKAGATAAFVLLLAVTSIQAEPQPTRLVVDATMNRYVALQEFLQLEGYWDDEVRAVLEPLEGRLSRGNGTPSAHLVGTLEDIPGLRPLPDGVVEFLHGRHNVYYVAVGKDRLLVGISSLVTQEEGENRKSTFHFEKYDLIEGRAETVGSSRRGPELSTFMFAHGPYLTPLLRLLVLGAALMAFLAIRLRREQGANLADPVIAAHRRQGQARAFQIAGVVWVAMLAAVYGLMHFSARIQFMEYLTAAETVSGSLTSRLALKPDNLRLASFTLAISLATLTVILLGVWSRALAGRRPKPGSALKERP